MIITGITPEQFIQIVARVGALSYQHNLQAEIGRRYTRADGSCQRFHARVIPVESGARLSQCNVGTERLSAAGARRSWSGRRIAAACWHAYRDVLAGVFEVNPNARVVTAMSKYVGLSGFHANYPATANANIGSMMQPAYMPELCDCERYGIDTREAG